MNLAIDDIEEIEEIYEVLEKLTNSLKKLSWVEEYKASLGFTLKNNNINVKIKKRDAELSLPLDLIDKAESIFREIMGFEVNLVINDNPLLIHRVVDNFAKNFKYIEINHNSIGLGSNDRAHFILVNCFDQMDILRDILTTKLWFSKAFLDCSHISNDLLSFIIRSKVYFRELKVNSDGVLIYFNSFEEQTYDKEFKVVFSPPSSFNGEFLYGLLKREIRVPKVELVAIDHQLSKENGELIPNLENPQGYKKLCIYFIEGKRYLTYNC
ncbi:MULTISPECIES: hypothetical protein [Sulfolobaceae]|uniref:hypothetical protein n=1 Tax=Sulfolobaceae TaxID=118883 RepID=UPI001180DAD3|nr:MULTISPECIES: hypothetical protein [unclassified Sulfolobus]